MIALRPMRSDEFAVYRGLFVPDYASEIEANFNLSAEDALVQSEREFGRDLPDGVDSVGQFLLCIVKDDGDDKPIGYLWYRRDDEARLAFIADFFVLPEHQGKGHGTEALAALEAMLAAEGLRQIRLRVAADNSRARHVYDAAGFRVTGHNLAKRIG